MKEKFILKIIAIISIISYFIKAIKDKVRLNNKSQLNDHIKPSGIRSLLYTPNTQSSKENDANERHSSTTEKTEGGG